MVVYGRRMQQDFIQGKCPPDAATEDELQSCF